MNLGTCFLSVALIILVSFAELLRHNDIDQPTPVVQQWFRSKIIVIQIDAYLHVCVGVCVSVCICVYVCIFVSACMCICIYVCECVLVCGGGLILRAFSFCLQNPHIKLSIIQV